AHVRAVVGVLDLSVIDPELVETVHPFLELLAVRTPERNVVGTHPELAERLVGRRLRVLVQPDERVALHQVHGVMEPALRVLVDHRFCIEERFVPGRTHGEIADVSATWVRGGNGAMSSRLPSSSLWASSLWAGAGER